MVFTGLRHDDLRIIEPLEKHNRGAVHASE
jgi:hypothetical protein